MKTQVFGKTKNTILFSTKKTQERQRANTSKVEKGVFLTTLVSTPHCDGRRWAIQGALAKGGGVVDFLFMGSSNFVIFWARGNKLGTLVKLGRVIKMLCKELISGAHCTCRELARNLHFFQFCQGCRPNHWMQRDKLGGPIVTAGGDVHLSSPMLSVAGLLHLHCTCNNEKCSCSGHMTLLFSANERTWYVDLEFWHKATQYAMPAPRRIKYQSSKISKANYRRGKTSKRQNIERQDIAVIKYRRQNIEVAKYRKQNTEHGKSGGLISKAKINISMHYNTKNVIL